MGLTGQTLNHYRILEKLGQGGMGEVYRAEDERIGRQVALKLLPANAVADESARQRVLLEARAVAALEHPNVCLLYEFGYAADRPYLAMQLVKGETLKRRIATGPLPEGKAREVILAVAAALEAAHARRIVHRDVKSDNVLLGEDGSIKLSDFGIARLGGDAAMTMTQAVLGTPGYLAPEQVEGHDATPASDQFALGVAAYECLTGELPFDNANVPAYVHAVLHREPAKPSARRPGIHVAWDVVLARALAKDPARRFPSVAAFAQAIGEISVGAAPGTAPQTPAGATPATGTTRPDTQSLAKTTDTSSVAVLYFENLSSDPESDYFCAGITEDILTDLSKIRQIRVASRNAVARYRGQAVDIPRVASDLGVATVVEGSVRKAGNRVRISAQLINAADGFHLWAERYDRTLDDVFAVQEDIAHSIAEALRVTLTPAEAAELRRERPQNAQAYDLYLQGRQHYSRYTKADLERALALFEEAVGIEPGYALAWAGIADTCAQMIQWGFGPGPTWLERGFAAAARAIELDPQLPEAHKAHALVRRFAGDAKGEREALRRAVAVNPRFVPALLNLGVESFCDGNLAKAERIIRRSLEIDPAEAFALSWLMTVLRLTDRQDEAWEAATRLGQLDTTPFYVMIYCISRAGILEAKGDIEGARGELAQGMAAGANPADIRGLEAGIALRQGSEEVARRWAELREERSIRGWPVMGEAVVMLLHFGETERARALLELPLTRALNPMFYRLLAGRRGVLEHPVFQSIDQELDLVWPSEARPLDPAGRARFRSYRTESGLPRPGEVF